MKSARSLATFPNALKGFLRPRDRAAVAAKIRALDEAFERELLWADAIAAARRGEAMTIEELRELLQDADELLRQAIQHQRGIGIDAGNSAATLRRQTEQKIALVRDVLAKVPIRTATKK